MTKAQLLELLQKVQGGLDPETAVEQLCELSNHKNYGVDSVNKRFVTAFELTVGMTENVEFTEWK